MSEQLFLIAGGLVLLLAGAECLVLGAERLARIFGISPLVIGLTIVAVGTSTPELSVTIGAVWHGNPGIGLGNVVGSNIINILLILGVCAVVRPLSVDRDLVWFDVPIMIGISLLVVFQSLDGWISRSDGAVLVALFFAYTAAQILRSRSEIGSSGGVRERRSARTTIPMDEERSRRTIGVLCGAIVLGLVLLVFGADVLMQGSVAFARSFGVSDLVIGLTIVAVGTSLPELGTSLVATLRGHQSIAVGNVVGSNVFNMLLVLGAGALFAPGGPGNGIPVQPAALTFDLPVMFATALIAFPILFTKYEVSRREGILLLGLYAGYAWILSRHSTPEDAGAVAGPARDLVVVPALIATVLWWCVQTYRQHQRQR